MPRFAGCSRLLLPLALALLLPACSLLPWLTPTPAPTPSASTPVLPAPAPPVLIPPEPVPPVPDTPAPAAPPPVVPAPTPPVPVTPAPAPPRQRPRTETPESSLARGQRLLADGQFGEAARIFEKLAATPDYADSAIAYVYLGIANLARINPANIGEAKMFRLKGLANFQNALRFDREVTLPKGYEKYSEVFEEARENLP